MPRDFGCRHVRKSLSNQHDTPNYLPASTQTRLGSSHIRKPILSLGPITMFRRSDLHEDATIRILRGTNGPVIAIILP
jgi:hypothetical protein